MAGNQTFLVGGLDDVGAGDDEDLVPLNEDGDDTVDAAAGNDDDDDDADDLFGDDDDPKQLRSDDDLADDIDDVDEGSQDRDPGKKGAKGQETAEEKRERRRAERQRKKERRDAAKQSQQRLIDQQARQLAETNARLYNLENRAGSADMARLDEAIVTAEKNKRIALQRQEAARDEGDLEAAAQAQDEWADFRDQERQLKAYKTQVTKGAGRPSAPKVDEAVRRHAEAFMEENKSWYTVGGQDEDSLIVDALDTALTNKGFDPSQKEYWDELRSRASRALPDRFPAGRRGDDLDDDDYDDGRAKPAPRPRGNRGRRSPNAGGGGDDRGVGSAADDINGIPREYINHLKDLGMWDEPEKRKEMIQRYRQSAAGATG